MCYFLYVCYLRQLTVHMCDYINVTNLDKEINFKLQTLQHYNCSRVHHCSWMFKSLNR